MNSTRGLVLGAENPVSRSICPINIRTGSALWHSPTSQMTKRSRRSSGSGLLDSAELFRDMPLAYAIAGAVLVGLLFEVIAPLLAPSYPKTSGINWAMIFLPVIQVFGGLFAGAILIFGLAGAVA